MADKRRLNPPKRATAQQKAVALKYGPGDIAPNVVAKGQGFVAERILDRGKKNSIPVYQDAKLTEELTKVDIGENIPPELYEVVARVLVFINDLDKMEQLKKYAQQQTE